MELSPESKKFLSGILGQDEEKLAEGIYTMVFTSYTPQRIAELQKYENEIYRIRAAKTHPWARCPGCGRSVLEKQLVKKGCYLCGWRGTKEEIESAGSESIAQIEEVDTLDEIKKGNAYRIKCPECGTSLVREQAIEKGCYICGWKPQ